MPKSGVEHLAQHPGWRTKKQPKRDSYENLLTRIKNLEKQNHLYAICLYDANRGIRPDFTDHSPSGTYYVALFRATYADGGYILLKNLTGDQPSCSIHLLDDIDDKWPIEVKILAERCRVERQKLLDREKEAERQTLGTA